MAGAVRCLIDFSQRFAFLASMSESNIPIAILGTGPVGLTAALALAQHGHKPVLIGPPVVISDPRTTAILGPSVGMLDDLGVTRDGRGNVAANTQDYATSESNVFACGDMRRGQSLVVWAIREGRQCARAVDKALMGVTDLPR